MEYEKWLIKTSSEIEKISQILNKPLSDDPNKLIEEIRIIESYFWRFHKLLAEAEMYLQEAEFEALKKAVNEKNATEKKYFIDYATKNERKIRDYLEGITKAIAKKIEAGQSILAYIRENKIVK